MAFDHIYGWMENVRGLEGQSLRGGEGFRGLRKGHLFGT